MATDNSQVHKGHRQRMRRKFVANSARSFDTYELLEMLLYNVIPYKDTNPVSKNLLSAFGSLDGVLRASHEELTSVEGVGSAVAEYIVTVGEITRLMLTEPASVGRRLDDFALAGAYFAELLCEYRTDVVAMALLDNRMNLIDVKIIPDLKYSSGALQPGPFLDSAILGRASVVMTAHRSAHGALYPTVGDMETSKMLTAALANVGILHIEHYLVWSTRYIGTLGREKYKVGQTAEIENFLKSREVAL